MSLTPETEWILVACGLIAHADGVLDGNEVERLMAMVDDRIPQEDYAEWLDIIGDKQRLEARYAALADPPSAQHRTILEEAWHMSMVDGDRNSSELVVLARIAERFGVEPMQLEFWRAAWTEAEQEFSNRVAELAALSLGGGQAVFEDDHSAFLDLMEQLPTSNDERQRLGAIATSPPNPPLDVDALARALAGMPRGRRLQAFTMVASVVRHSVDRDNARERFEKIGRAAGLLEVGDLL
jgi:uncharacterized tellurite resistance protein B-like protein